MACWDWTPSSPHANAGSNAFESNLSTLVARAMRPNREGLDQSDEGRWQHGYGGDQGGFGVAKALKAPAIKGPADFLPQHLDTRVYGPYFV